MPQQAAVVSLYLPNNTRKAPCPVEGKAGGCTSMFTSRKATETKQKESNSLGACSVTSLNSTANDSVPNCSLLHSHAQHGAQ